MSDKEKLDKLMALAQAIAVVGSGAKITREMSEIAHEVTGLGTGR